MVSLNRRAFLRAGALTGTAAVLGPDFWRSAYAQPATAGAGPYGGLDGIAADANGLVLPEGFTSRVIGTSGMAVAGTDYLWHAAPDGGATFTADDDGWIYVSNSEFPLTGGAGAVRFDADGEIVDAYRILDDTTLNCAGGLTPWGTWLSCEEYDTRGAWAVLADRVPAVAGQVWECDPTGAEPAKALPGLGLFQHEAAAVDPEGGAVYLSEDQADGKLYRFVADDYPDLSAGMLEVAVVEGDTVRWVEVPDPSAADAATRTQVAEATTFPGGEGLWFDQGIVYFTTKGDNRVQAVDTTNDAFEVIYDGIATPDAPLKGVDNITVERGSGDLLVAEDGDNMEIVVITADREVAPFLRIEGHEESEVTGPAFSPDGTRLYLSSQRGVAGTGTGVTYEVTGPFRGPDLMATDTPAPTTTLANASDEQAASDDDDGGGDALPVVLGVAGAGVAAAAIGLVAVRSRRAR
jgi:secreted PhoX family phosphatase